MTTKKTWEPDWAVHPGQVVRECIAESGMTLRAFAAKLGLEAHGYGGAQLWVRMQADHDLFIERKKSESGAP